MKKIKYFLLSIIFALLCNNNVLAESLKLDLINEIDNKLEFNVIVDELNKNETINVYEGTITYPSNDVSLSLIKEERWEVYYKEETGKIRFLAYNLNGYAQKDTSILKFNTTLKDKKTKEVKVALNNITTSDGLENIDIGQATYNYKKVVVETPVAPETEIPKKEELVEKPKEEVKEETTDKKEENENDNDSIPEDDLINEIEEITANESKENKESKDNNYGFIISLVLVLLLISLIVTVFVWTMKTEKTEKVDPKKEIKKEEKKTPKRRGRKKKTSKGVDK